MTSTVDLVDDAVADESAKKEKTFMEMDLKEKISYIKEIMTVEPLIGAYIMASTLCTPTLYNLEYEKACRVNLQMNDTVCEAILSGDNSNYTDQNTQVQILISDMHSWQQPMQSIMPLIMILFLGSFSDRHKWRKPFLILPLLGEMLSVAGCLLSVVFMKTWPLEVLGVFQLVVPSFFGGQPMLTMAVFAYIADVSTLEMRTLRIGMVQIVLNAIVPATQFISAQAFELIGYYGVFLIAGTLYVFGVVYGLYWIKEPEQPERKFQGGFFYDVFNPRHAIDTITLVFKKSPGNNRLYMLFMFIIVFFYSAVVVGEAGVFYWYSNNTFNWTIVEFSYFLTFNTLIHLSGTAVGVPLFTKILHLSDIVILLLTFMNKIVSNVIFAFAESSAVLYAAAAVSLITGITPIVIRSLETKVVSENDLGKAQSLFGICEAIAPAVATPIYDTVIYNNTLTTFPGAFFFFGILLYAVSSIIIIRMYFDVKRKQVKSNSTNGVEINGKDNMAMENCEESTHI
ncbi:lysosomal proton-coupled steroid conjugate and bile acid symporter SLC46A3-like [Diabrotica undecimpunctata]|uniref:lysosomal proton-coupled steroid conjugate and bile acid symporter SLC46A3-like n=1 Tax=Diabrotica undecimpunctata TaxID=50387 RepID=UPI003B634BBE